MGPVRLSVSWKARARDDGDGDWEGVSVLLFLLRLSSL